MTIYNVTIQHTLCNARSTFRAFTILRQKTHKKRLFEYMYMYINKFIFQTKDYQLVFVAYNAKHAELRRKSKDWLSRNQDNVSEWSDMYIHGLLFPLDNTIKKTKRVGLEKSDHLINLVSPWYSYRIAELALNNNRSLTKAVTYSFYISPTMYVYYIVFILQCLVVKKTTGKLSKKSRNRHRSKRFRRRCLYCKFLGVARHGSGTRKTISWSKS